MTELFSTLGRQMMARRREDRINILRQAVITAHLHRLFKDKIPDQLFDEVEDCATSTMWLTRCRVSNPSATTLADIAKEHPPIDSIFWSAMIATTSIAGATLLADGDSIRRSRLLKRAQHCSLCARAHALYALSWVVSEGSPMDFTTIDKIAHAKDEAPYRDLVLFLFGQVDQLIQVEADRSRCQREWGLE